MTKKITLLEFIKEKDMTITQFAQSIGYTRNHISKICSGYSKPSQHLKFVIDLVSEGKVKL